MFLKPELEKYIPIDYKSAQATELNFLKQFSLEAEIVSYKGLSSSNMSYLVKADDGHEYIILNPIQSNPIRLEIGKKYRFYAVLTKTGGKTPTLRAEYLEPITD